MNFSLFDKRMETVVQLTNSIFPLIILPVATFGNSLCFLVFCRQRFQKCLTRTSSICLRLLCINDSILLYLFIIDVLLRIYMKPSIRIYSTPTTCRLYKFIRYSFLDMSAYLQLGLTTDRFICCVHHTYYRHWRKKNYLYYLLSIAFFLIFLKNSSFLSTFYGYPALHKNRTITKCSVVIEAKHFATYMAYGQTLIDVVFITCLPFFLILYFNSRILSEVLRLRTPCWSTLTRFIHLTPGQNETTIRNQAVILTRHHARHRRLHLTFALGCISFVFVLSTAPYKIFKIVERHDKLIRDQQKHGISKSIYIQLAEVIIDCLEYISCSTPFFVCLLTSIECNSQLITRTEHPLSCHRSFANKTLLFTCPIGSILKDLDFDGLEDLNIFEKLHVVGNTGRGPLRLIPTNICRLKQLRSLYLANNRIKNATFEYNSSCLSQLEVLDLSNNYLRKLPDRWISQMFNLKSLNISNNKLTCLPNTMFFNISNLDKLDVSSNHLISFELWLIQIKNLINYSNNSLTHFSNDYNVDLSNYQSNMTAKIFLNNTKIKINFDDSIFPMYNRCQEINSTDNKNYLMQAIGIIHKTNPGVLRFNCSCKQYYLQKYIISITSNSDFMEWSCGNPPQIFRKICSNQSSFDFLNVNPRFCKVNQSEEGSLSIHMKSGFCNSVENLESMAIKILKKLSEINLLNEATINKFVDIIDASDDELKSFISPINSNSIENLFENIIVQIEDLIESINTTMNISLNSIAILSVLGNSSIDSFSQINQIDSSLMYSTDRNLENSIATITIEHLNITDIYTFYYLPSIFFQLAENNPNIIIVSPIVGIHLPKNSPHKIQMSFTDIERLFGRYLCVFWQIDQWNSFGCLYSKDLKTNRHWCFCNHTTSFALIFIPHKTIEKTYIPSITIAFISILCFTLSIILSIYRQTTSFRHLSITNIFALLNSIILFILLTVILIRGYQSKMKIRHNCSISEENLVLTTYFFLITTFASKTLLGICYFLTIFYHFVFIELTTLSNKWFYGSFLLVIFVALIPTVVIKLVFKEWKNFFVQYQGICWFNSSEIFRLISIPIIIFLCLNVLIIFGITIRLIRFSLTRKTIQTNEKRLIISIMIWIALCVLLGFAWIFGPLLDVMISDNEKTSAVIQVWIFGIFLGLEGVWVLIVNVVFYFTQKVNIKNRQMISKKHNK